MPMALLLSVEVAKRIEAASSSEDALVDIKDVDLMCESSLGEQELFAQESVV